MSIDILHLSRIVRSPLIDHAGDRIGRVEDVVARLVDSTHPPVVGLVVRFSGRDLFVPARKIASFEEGVVRFSGQRVDLRRFERREGELLLAKDLLARHLINLVGGRLVRASDILLAHSGASFEVVAVDTARRAMLRRIFRVQPSAHSSTSVVDFASIAPFFSHVPTSKLRIPYRQLAKLHPAQIADLVEAASHEEGEEIIHAVAEDVELEADVFEELDTEHQVEFLTSRSNPDAARLLERMAPDDAADLITEVVQERRLAILELLPEPQQHKVRSLLSYNPETAGGIMTPDFVSVGSDATVAQAIEAVRASSAPTEAHNAVYLLDDDGRLAGCVTLAMLVRAEPTDRLSEVARVEPAHVHPNWDLNRTARKMSDFNLTVVPVVEEDHGLLVGVVTIDDLIELLLPQGWRRDFGMAAVEE